MTDKVELTEDQWRERLTPEQYRVLRKEGTERAGTGRLAGKEGAGAYRCAGCGTDLFAAEHAFDSGTGWPSFSDVAHPDDVGTRTDRRLLMKRTEVHCDVCGGHLGHVFEDGPAPTGLRYCLNSAALDFAPADGSDVVRGARDA